MSLRVLGLFISVTVMSVAMIFAQGPTHTWTTQGFAAFRKGNFDSSGADLYVSKKGILQMFTNFSTGARRPSDWTFRDGGACALAKLT